jgi:hypothetical protein
VRAIGRRVQRLERAVGIGSSPRIRYVLTIAGTDVEVPKSTFEKTHNDNGTLMELVTLAGSEQDITDEALDRFVAEFSGSTVKRRG